MYKDYKMDQRSNYKNYHYKILEENIEEMNHDVGFGNGFLDMTPKAQAEKE